MKNMDYELVLGYKYIFLSTPDSPIMLAPVTTRAHADAETPQQKTPPPSNNEFRKAQRDDPSLKPLFSQAEKNNPKPGKPRYIFKANLLYRLPRENEPGKTQLVVPLPYRQQVMETAHDSAMGAHQGQSATVFKVKYYYFWPGMYGDIKRFVSSCHQCQITSKKHLTTPVPLGQTPVVDTPFQRVSVDLLGPLNRTRKRNAYILCVVCQATNWPEAVALPSMDAKHVAEALFTMFTRVGFPEVLLSDNGAQFTGSLMKEVLQIMNTKHLRTSPYHPQANGLVERFNQTVVGMLRKVAYGNTDEWDTYLPAALYAYRTTPHASLGYSPYEMIYGSQPRGPLEILRRPWTKENPHQEEKTVHAYVKQLKARLECARKIAQSNLLKARRKQAKHFNRRAKERSLVPGDKVLLLLPASYNKLQIMWKGPYVVTAQISPTNYSIKVGNKEKRYHINLLKRYPERPLTDTPLLALAIAEETGPDDTLTAYPAHGKESVRDVDICPNLTPKKSAQARAPLNSYADVLTDKHCRTDLEKFSMKLTDTTPISVKPYPIPYAKAKLVEEEVKYPLVNNIITPSTSPYNAPVVLVRKSDVTHRMCIDFRRLNSVTEFQSETMHDPNTLMATVTWVDNSIAGPLSNLTKEGQPGPVSWTNECDPAFCQPKPTLTSSPILRLLDLTRPFTLQTDARLCDLQSDPTDNECQEKVTRKGKTSKSNTLPLSTNST